MRNPFISYLVDRGFLRPELAIRLDDETLYSREPIGAIAAQHGLLRPDEIDAILNRQRTISDRFGEIAVDMGFLNPGQVENLVKIQSFRACADIAELLVLRQDLTYEDMLNHLGAFLAGEPELAAVLAES